MDPKEEIAWLPFLEITWLLSRKFCNDGVHGLRLRVRVDDSCALMHFVHLDISANRRTWDNMICLRVTPNGVLSVEHAVRCAEPSDPNANFNSVGLIVPEPPRTVRLLTAGRGPRVMPAEFAKQGIRTLDSGQVRPFVSTYLCSADRSVACVIVAPRSSGEFLIVPEELAERLLTIAGVYVLQNQSAVEEFIRALAHTGYPREFSCFNGGVRIYPPGFPNANGTSDHLDGNRLWTGALLIDIDPRERCAWLAGQITNWHSRNSTPLGFWAEIQHFDRAVLKGRSANYDLLLAQVRLKDASPETLAKIIEGATQRDIEYNQLLGELEKTLQDKEKVEQDSDYLQDRYKEIQAKLREAESKSTALEEMIQARKANNTDNEVLDEGARVALEAVMLGSADPSQCLQALALLYPDRVEIFPSAFKAAEKVKSFHVDSRAKLWELCRKLATSYWEARAAGTTDLEAGKLFGNKSYAAQESETTRRNADCMSQRTFRDREGKDWTMVKHLKIGVAHSASLTLRIHFEWDSKRRLVLIGYCGEHLGI